MSVKRPNVLLIMFDQLAPQFLPMYGHPLVQTPAMQAISERGTLFENTYCNSPLCAPSRFSMLSGRHCSRIGAYDNAAEFSSDIPTIAHYLRRAGYRTCLAGKMHLIGPDQLHGFEQRITTDMYPADFGWTPDWTRPDEPQFWHHNMQSVVEAGIYERTLTLDFDDEVAFESRRWIFDTARDDDTRPFFFVVSFMQPHDPYMTPQRYWDRYDHARIDMPRTPELGDDAHSQRLARLCRADEYRVDEARVRNARHAYYGMVSFLDDQVAALRTTLEEAGFGDDTLCILTADHGDLLGEHGLWYKMHFFEHAVRVPLMLAGPDIPSGRVERPVSLLDLLPTLLEYTGDGVLPELAAPIDGESLLSDIEGGTATSGAPVVAEYLAEGAVAPMLMVRDGRYKYIHADGDEPMLHDLVGDPLEQRNLSGDPSVSRIEAELEAIASAHWDSEAVRESVIASQQRRLFIQAALQIGTVRPWDFQPLRDASRLYNRNLGGEMYDTDRRARIPYRGPPAPDGPGDSSGDGPGDGSGRRGS